MRELLQSGARSDFVFGKWGTASDNICRRDGYDKPSNWDRVPNFMNPEQNMFNEYFKLTATEIRELFQAHGAAASRSRAQPATSEKETEMATVIRKSKPSKASKPSQRDHKPKGNRRMVKGFGRPNMKK